jgi:hypothetical protein
MSILLGVLGTERNECVIAALGGRQEALQGFVSGIHDEIPAGHGRRASALNAGA